MSQTSTEYNTYLNILEYVKGIGYTIIDEVKNETDGVGDTYKTFVKTMQFMLYVDITAKKDKKKLHIFQINKEMPKITNTLFSKVDNNVPVILVGDTFVNRTRSVFEYGRKKIPVTYLNTNLFKMNIRNNVMVPRHELCSEEEKVEIMNSNFIDNIKDFPKIKYNDPQVILLDGERDQLVKITRKDVTTGESIYYRVIV